MGLSIKKWVKEEYLGDNKKPPGVFQEAFCYLRFFRFRLRVSYSFGGSLILFV
jgi:hypothetical protein